jgi:hypothetical protein
MPPEVAARLDATLADLVAERPAAQSGQQREEAAGDAPAPAPVVPLEERRRRRWPRVLVAAASVSVLAYGVGFVLNGLELSGGSAESTAARDETFAGGGAGADTDSGLVPEDAPQGLEGPRDGVQVQGSRVLARKLLVAGTVRLHSGSLREEVQRLVDSTVDARGPVPLTDRKGTLDTLASCAEPATARGDRLAAARFDGQPATLVLRKATGGARVAEVYSCGDGSRLIAQTRVPSSD